MILGVIVYSSPRSDVSKFSPVLEAKYQCKREYAKYQCGQYGPYPYVLFGIQLFSTVHMLALKSVENFHVCLIGYQS